MKSTVCVTPSGKIFGVNDNGVCKYLGVKYATAQRFEKPIEVTTHKDNEATAFGACCPQSRQFHDESAKKNTLWYDEFRKGLKFEYSEDCLFLNVYAPENAQDCPVLLYVHGGSFVKGSAADRPFDGTTYAKKGAIVVTFNYRLNIFSFYPYQTPNLALWDMLCALSWVRHNIADFGGNAEDITLWGQSAGAMCVQALILNDDVKKQVKGAIMQSGGGLLHGLYAPKSLARAKRFFKKVDAQLEKGGLDAKTAKYEDLYLAWESVSHKSPISSMLSTMFVFDGVLIKKENYKNIDKKELLPCIISVTKDDLQPRSYLVKSAQKYAKQSKAPVWIYAFDRDLPGDDKGAWHSADLWYTFGALELHPWRKFEKRDYTIADNAVDTIIGFAKSGKCEAKPKEWISIK